MPITTDLRDDEQLAIIKMAGNLEALEIETLNLETLKPFLVKHAPSTVDVIWDVTEFDWTFDQFVEYLSYARKRRKDSSTPVNIRQHYVGQNAWIQNFRTWMSRTFNVQTTVFTNMENALDYVKKLKTSEAST